MYVHGEVQLTGSKVAEGIADFVLNTQGTLLASAARTTTIITATQTNYNARGMQIFLNVTAASATGGLAVRIIAGDPVAGTSHYLNNPPTNVTAIGQYSYVLYPAVAAINGNVVQSVNLALPRSWFIQVTHIDATSYTYSLGYALIL